MSAVFLLAALLGAAQGTPSPNAGPTTAQADPIVGTWLLNVERSDDPREAMQTMRGRANPPGGFGSGRGAPPGGRGGSGGFGGGRPPGGGFGPEGRGDSTGFNRGPMALVMRPADRIAIQVVDATINLVASNQPPLMLYTDGKKWTETIEGQGDVEFKVKREHDKLEVERKFKESGMTLKETYVVQDNGELVVDIRFSGARMPQPLQLKRVYDRAESGS